MWRLLKLVFFLAVLCGVGLVAYAYVGPIFGADFVPPQVSASIDVDGATVTVAPNVAATVDFTVAGTADVDIDGLVTINATFANSDG